MSRCRGRSSDKALEAALEERETHVINLGSNRMKNFGLSLTLFAAAAVSSCDDGQQRQKEWSASGPTQLCTDRDGRRVPDENCQRHYGGGGMGLAFLPFFIGRGGYIPSYGGIVRDGSRTATSGLAYGHAAAFTSGARGSSAFGGVSRGGFGSSAHASVGAGE